MSDPTRTAEPAARITREQMMAWLKEEMPIDDGCVCAGCRSAAAENHIRAAIVAALASPPNLMGLYSAVVRIIRKQFQPMQAHTRAEIAIGKAFDSFIAADLAALEQPAQEVAAEFYLCSACSRHVRPVNGACVLDSGTTLMCEVCGAATVITLSRGGFYDV